MPTISPDVAVLVGLIVLVLLWAHATGEQNAQRRSIKRSRAGLIGLLAAVALLYFSAPTYYVGTQPSVAHGDSSLLRLLTEQNRALAETTEILKHLLFLCMMALAAALTQLERRARDSAPAGETA